MRARLPSFFHFSQERSQDLELCQGNAAAILGTVDELLHWVEEEMEQEFLHQLPPGELDRLKSNVEGLQVRGWPCRDVLLPVCDGSSGMRVEVEEEEDMIS